MLKLLPTTYFLVPAFAYILLLFGCGAEETVNLPSALSDEIKLNYAYQT